MMLQQRSTMAREDDLNAWRGEPTRAIGGIFNDDHHRHRHDVRSRQDHFSVDRRHAWFGDGEAAASHRRRVGALRRRSRARRRDAAQVDAGEICGLIGPNGAGKTTLFNCITRLYPVASGAISFAGRADRHRSGARRSSTLGIARTFQNLGIYPDMTVLENVLLGAHHSHGGRFFRPSLQPSDLRRAGARDDRVVPLDPARARSRSAHESARAGNLPYGTLKRVEIARALAAKPRLLLLDEPAAGLNHGERDRVRNPDQAHPRRVRAHRAAGRASDGAGDGPVRAAARAPSRTSCWRRERPPKSAPIRRW